MKHDLWSKIVSSGIHCFDIGPAFVRARELGYLLDEWHFKGTPAAKLCLSKFLSDCLKLSCFAKQVRDIRFHDHVFQADPSQLRFSATAWNTFTNAPYNSIAKSLRFNNDGSDNAKRTEFRMRSLFNPVTEGSERVAQQQGRVTALPAQLERSMPRPWPRS